MSENIETRELLNQICSAVAAANGYAMNTSWGNPITTANEKDHYILIAAFITARYKQCGSFTEIKFGLDVNKSEFDKYNRSKKLRKYLKLKTREPIFSQSMLSNERRGDKGTFDMIIEVGNKIFIIEFKLLRILGGTANRFSVEFLPRLLGHPDLDGNILNDISKLSKEPNRIFNGSHISEIKLVVGIFYFLKKDKKDNIFISDFNFKKFGIIKSDILKNREFSLNLPSLNDHYLKLFEYNFFAFKTQFCERHGYEDNIENEISWINVDYAFNPQKLRQVNDNYSRLFHNRVRVIAWELLSNK
jgi:hypothetical protein